MDYYQYSSKKYIKENIANTSFTDTQGLIYSIINDTNVRVTFSTITNSEITIPSSIESNGKSYIVNSIGIAIGSNNQLKTISIPSTITLLDSRAFYNFTSLTNVNFSEGLKYIGQLVFYNCVSLKEITIPTSVESIDTNIFGGCTGLEKIIILSSTIIIDGLLCDGCTNLRYIYFLCSYVPFNISSTKLTKLKIIVDITKQTSWEAPQYIVSNLVYTDAARNYSYEYPISFTDLSQITQIVSQAKDVNVVVSEITTIVRNNPIFTKDGTEINRGIEINNTTIDTNIVIKNGKSPYLLDWSGDIPNSTRVPELTNSDGGTPALFTLCNIFGQNDLNKQFYLSVTDKDNSANTIQINVSNNLSKCLYLNTTSARTSASTGARTSASTSASTGSRTSASTGARTSASTGARTSASTGARIGASTSASTGASTSYPVSALTSTEITLAALGATTGAIIATTAFNVPHDIAATIALALLVSITMCAVILAKINKILHRI